MPLNSHDNDSQLAEHQLPEDGNGDHVPHNEEPPADESSEGVSVERPRERPGQSTERDDTIGDLSKAQPEDVLSKSVGENDASSLALGGGVGGERDPGILEARRILKAAAPDAARKVIELSKEAGRNAGTQLQAANSILDRAGVTEPKTTGPLVMIQNNTGDVRRRGVERFEGWKPSQ